MESLVYYGGKWSEVLEETIERMKERDIIAVSALLLLLCSLMRCGGVEWSGGKWRKLKWSGGKKI